MVFSMHLHHIKFIVLDQVINVTLRNASRILGIPNKPLMVGRQNELTLHIVTAYSLVFLVVRNRLRHLLGSCEQ